MHVPYLFFSIPYAACKLDLSMVETHARDHSMLDFKSMVVFPTIGELQGILVCLGLPSFIQSEELTYAVAREPVNELASNGARIGSKVGRGLRGAVISYRWV